MVLYYAVGGGLGHVTRACAVMHTLSISEPVTVISSLPLPEEARLPQNITLLVMPQDCRTDVHRGVEWIIRTLLDLTYDRVIIDTFPAGITGELKDLSFWKEKQSIHIARSLKDFTILSQLSNSQIHFETVRFVEELPEEQFTFLSQRSDSIEFLDLCDPPVSLSVNDHLLRQILEDFSTAWLIVHAGSDKEVRTLVEYAQERARFDHVAPQFILASPSSPDGIADDILHVKIWPVYPYFPFMDCVVSGCGFNTVRQVRASGVKHYYIPFERRFDNQFRRASALRGNTEWT